MEESNCEEEEQKENRSDIDQKLNDQKKKQNK